LKKRRGEFVKIKVGEGRRATVYEGDIYSKEFCETLRIIMQKHYGTKLPSSFKKLLEPIK